MTSAEARGLCAAVARYLALDTRINGDGTRVFGFSVTVYKTDGTEAATFGDLKVGQAWVQDMAEVKS